MTEPRSTASRREFLKTTGLVAATSALAQTAVPLVHAGESNTIQVALVGCGGRGTGAAANALSVKNGPIKLVAMADVFDPKLKNSYHQLHKEFCCDTELDVPEDRKFIGFDAYKQGDGLPQAGRRGHPRHAAGLPLGALHLRDREGPERLHGEAGHGRRPHHPQDAGPGREVAAEEPQGRRRPDVPPLQGPRRSCFDRIKDGEIGDIIAAAGLSPDRPGRLDARAGPSPTTSAS